MHSLHKTQLALQRLTSLSTPAPTTLRFLELSLAEESSLKDVVALVRTDPGLAVEVLRSHRTHAAAVARKDALNLPKLVQSAGLEAVREIALRVEMRGGSAAQKTARASHAHAIACASAAFELAQLGSYPEPEVAWTCGLLSSIGWLALSELYPAESSGMCARDGTHEFARWIELERETIGVDHEHLGTVMVDTWALPCELRDVIVNLHRTAEQVDKLATAGADLELVRIVRTAWHVAHQAGFPCAPRLTVESMPADVQRRLESIDAITLIETTQGALGRAHDVARPRGTEPKQVLTTIQRAHLDVQVRLSQIERKLRAEESISSVLQYGLQRLGDGDPLPGVMFHSMETIGYKRICCLELDLAAAKLEVRLSAASSGFDRVVEKRWIPFPGDRPQLGTPAILQRNDRVPAHQRVLELIGVASAVIAPLQEIQAGKRWLLCADRGPAGPAPVAGEERVLGIIADQASLLLKFEQLAREKERMATLDTLTGAATRRRMMDRLEFLITQSERTRTPFSVLLMDLDHFKKFNDTCGHQTGDKLLQDLVRVFSASIRRGDLVARYGGEEFVVLLPSCNGLDAVAIGEELRKKVYAYGTENSATFKGLQVSISMGAAEWVRGETPLQLIGRADTALYEAKRGGRNCVMPAAA